MNSVKRSIGIVLVGLFACVGTAWAAYTPNTVHLEDFGAVDAATVQRLELGQWYSNWSVCKAYAEEHGIPMFAVWSSHNCSNCFTFDSILTNVEFKVWQQTHDAGQVICCIMCDGEGTLDQRGSPAYNWMLSNIEHRDPSSVNFPLVAFYWPSHSVDRHVEGTMILSFNAITSTLETEFADWHTGCSFKASGTAFDRYEAEPGVTEFVTITLERSVIVSASAGVNYWDAAYPDGTTSEKTRIDWAAGETNRDIRVAIDTAKSAGWNGSDIVVRLYGETGSAFASSPIAVVHRGNSVDNPLWKTERTEETLQWGEWTCDLKTATNKVAAAVKGGGEAWTLVYSHGSQWCPYCYLNGLSFVETQTFLDWARGKHVALVSVDTPHCSDEKPDVEIGTIWNRKADTTNLYFDGNGAVLRSGTGYLSRKMISDEEAEETRQEMIDLNRGFLHLPEDYQTARAIIPGFALVDASGKVVGRFETFDYDMNMNTNGAKAAVFCQRLSEMIETAKTSPDREFENLNDNCRTTAAEMPVFAAGTGGNVSSGTISHADYRDVRRLTGVKPGADAIFRCRGARAAQSRLCLIKDIPGSPIPELVATATNLLSGEIVLDTSTIDGFAFEDGVTYYVRISCRSFWPNEPYAKSDPDYRTFRLRWGDGDDGFSRDYRSDYAESTISAYGLSAETLCVPVDGRRTVEIPAGCRVLLRVEDGVSYMLSGFDDGELPSGLAPDQELGAGFYKASVSGDLAIAAKAGGGTFSYQAWLPGEAQFAEESKVAFTHSGSTSIDVVRVGGASGPLSATVKLVRADEQAEGGYSWTDQRLDWEDGGNEVKSVALGLIKTGSDSWEGMLTFGLFSGELQIGTMQVLLRNTEAPCFEQPEYGVDVPLAFSAGGVSFKVVNARGGLMTVSKVDGDLPSGVRIGYDPEREEVVLSGVPKETGTYSVTCILSERRPDGTLATGYETTIAIRVEDPAEVNPFVRKKRDSQMVALYDRTGDRPILDGVLTVAITSQGRISAKYQGQSGSRVLSFDGKWESFDFESGVASTVLPGTFGGTLALRLDAEGSLEAELRGESVSVDGRGELPDEAFDAYAGFYNVALPTAETSEICPSNTAGNLALTMKTRSTVARGLVRFVGRLPNGVPVSGTAMLERKPQEDGTECCFLPVFRRTSRDVLSAVLRVKPDGALHWDDMGEEGSTSATYNREVVEDEITVCSMIRHVDANEQYDLRLKACGVWYPENVSPASAVNILYRERPFFVKDDPPGFSFTLMIGETAVADVVSADRAVKVDRKRIEQLTYSFTRRNGSFGGRAKVRVDGKDVMGTYKGVLIPGWVRTCDCGVLPPERPYGMGSFWYKTVEDGKTVARCLPVAMLEPEE